MEDLSKLNVSAGLRTTLRAIAQGKAEKVYVAEDADVFVRRQVAEAAAEKGVEVERVPDMKTLGKACALQVKCACCAVLRPEA